MLLLSLLGEQPIPNLLPLWQDSRYTATQFAATQATLPLAVQLASFIRRDPQLGRLTVLETIRLAPYDLAQSRAVLSGRLADCQLAGQPVCLNFTGGTKLMGLAALQAAFGSGVSLLYVATEENRLITLGSDGAERASEPIRVRVDVEQYLRAHGLDVGTSPNFGRGPARPRQAVGDPLEQRVFQAARKAGVFDDVRRQVFIRRFTERGPVLNELDIVVTRNGRLVVCSCKSGRSATREALYELASLSRREAAGIYCGKVLVSDQPDLPPALRDRARASGVRLVYGPELPNVASHLRLAAEH